MEFQGAVQEPEGDVDAKAPRESVETKVPACHKPGILCVADLSESLRSRSQRTALSALLKSISSVADGIVAHGGYLMIQMPKKAYLDTPELRDLIAEFCLEAAELTSS